MLIDLIDKRWEFHTDTDDSLEKKIALVNSI